MFNFDILRILEDFHNLLRAKFMLHILHCEVDDLIKDMAEKVLFDYVNNIEIVDVDEEYTPSFTSVKEAKDDERMTEVVVDEDEVSKLRRKFDSLLKETEINFR